MEAKSLYKQFFIPHMDFIGNASRSLQPPAVLSGRVRLGRFRSLSIDATACRRADNRQHQEGPYT